MYDTRIGSLGSHNMSLLRMDNDARPETLVLVSLVPRRIFMKMRNTKTPSRAPGCSCLLLSLTAASPTALRILLGVLVRYGRPTCTTRLESRGVNRRRPCREHSQGLLQQVPPFCPTDTPCGVPYDAVVYHVKRVVRLFQGV